MKSLTILPTALYVLLMVTIAAGQDKTPPIHQYTYQKGTITGWIDLHQYGRVRYYELRVAGMVYQISDCGSFQSGKFKIGQVVDYRVDDSDENDMRVYIQRDKGKEYSCRMEGARIPEVAKPDTPSTAPAAAPATAAPPA